MQTINLNLKLVMLSLIYPLLSYSQTIDSHYLDGAIYAKLYDTSTAHLNLFSPPLDSLVAVYGLDTMYWPFKALNSTQLDQTYRLEFSNLGKVDSLIIALEALPMIEYAEKVPLGTTNFQPNDLHSNQTAYLTRILAQQAWDISKGSSQVVVAVVDMGVRLTHEDLAANLWVNPGEIPGNLIDDDGNGRIDDINGFDIADNDNNPNPPPGISSSSGFNHGTHCAGIVSAVTDNGKGISSIGFKLKIMAVKVARNNGNDRELSHPYEGVAYAMRSGADVISMSFGGPGTSQTVTNLMNTGFNSGVILVAAAGNDTSNVPSLPASVSNVISVGATNSSNDQITFFSNFGTTIDVMAPGLQIFSTLGNADNSYGFQSGTSMACPLVAGLVGLMLSVNPSLTPAQVVNFLRSGCDNINSSNPGFSGQIGAGRINAFNTLSLLTGTGVIKSEAAANEGVVVYPNPFSNRLHVTLSEDDEEAHISIFDMPGKNVFYIRSEGIAKEMDIPVHDLSPGIYFLQVKTNDTFYSKRIYKHSGIF